jgi:hypothetical protein
MPDRFYFCARCESDHHLPHVHHTGSREVLLRDGNAAHAQVAAENKKKKKEKGRDVVRYMHVQFFSGSNLYGVFGLDVQRKTQKTR